MSDDPESVVWVRLRWNGRHKAKYRLADVEGVHWDTRSDDSDAPDTQPFLYGYVWCNGAIEGELDHSCGHRGRPHRLKVCIVKTGNEAVYYQLERRVGPRPAHDAGPSLTLMAQYHRARAERARAEEAERTTPEGLPRAAERLSATFRPLVGDLLRRDPSITTIAAARLMLEEVDRMAGDRRRRIERDLQVTALADLLERLLADGRPEKGG